MKEEQKIPVFPASPQDRMNYLMGLYSAVQQIGAAIHVAGSLDPERLKLAVRLCASRNPVLKSRFVEAETPYWEERDIEPAFEVRHCKEEDRTDSIEAYLAQPIDWINGPVLDMRLFKAETDSLAFKVSHLCMDGAGVKEFIGLLAALYTRLIEGETYASLHRDLAEGGHGVRDHSTLFAAAGITDPATAIRQQAGTASLWAFPYASQDNRTPSIAIRRMEKQQTETFIDKVKSVGATVNDGLLAAYFRVLVRHAKHIEPRTKEKAVGLTVDLRRYLPDRTTGALCNLSGMEIIEIGLDEGEPFKSTLQKVKQTMDIVKANNPGLSSAAAMEKMAEMPFASGKALIAKQHELASQMQMALPIMTNFGSISNSATRFGACEAESAYMASPIMHAPFFSMGASSYRHILTLSVGYHTPAVSGQAVTGFLDDMMLELSKAVI